MMMIVLAIRRVDTLCDPRLPRLEVVALVPIPAPVLAHGLPLVHARIIVVVAPYLPLDPVLALIPDLVQDLAQDKPNDVADLSPPQDKMQMILEA